MGIKFTPTTAKAINAYLEQAKIITELRLRDEPVTLQHVSMLASTRKQATLQIFQDIDNVFAIRHGINLDR